ncbi:MAG: hypothetical protein R2822_04805 [Spirosomataceae bacterium]
MLTFAMFLKMANGTTYAITPFVNPKAVGVISESIVGARGNVGGMLMGFLFRVAIHQLWPSIYVYWYLVT